MVERVLSPEERIRRAEELYYRRKNPINASKTAKVNINSKKDYKLLKKIIVQVLICVGIYTLIYNLQGKEDSFSTDSLSYLRNTIAYDIDLNKYWNSFRDYMYSFIPNEETKDLTYENEIVEETLSATEEESTEQTVLEEVTQNTEEASSISQMEQDAEYIKTNFSLIKPIAGVVTSRFGLRNPTTATVPKYHTGIDIGVAEGTVFVSSMQGTVELVSSEGDYGNHIKITNGDVMTLYAHCKTIYVKEGDKIEQGQEIGETGSTGNVTGPHLHFEIRRNNEYVNPDLLLSF